MSLFCHYYFHTCTVQAYTLRTHLWPFFTCMSCCTQCLYVGICSLTHSLLFTLGNRHGLWLYHLMLVRNALRDLWHERCVRVADTARGEAKCCITPQDHNPSAKNHVKHELINFKWLIVAPWLTLRCVLTFDGVYWWFLLILHGQYHAYTARAKLCNLWMGRCLWCRPQGNNKDTNQKFLHTLWTCQNA